MSRSVVFALLFTPVALALSARPALAADCPDGWFCDDSAAPPSGPPAPPSGDRLPPPPPPPGAAPETAPPYAPPPYPPPDESTLFVDRPENAPPPPMKRRHRRPYHEWGFNLHLEDAILGDKAGKASNAGMGGVGFSFRYRPLPPVAFEAGIDLLTGTDFQGYSRDEGALLLNTLVFFNPHSVVQVYALGGIGFSTANVKIAPRAGEAPFPSHNEEYDYFGGQLGLGVEVRVTHNIALGGDLIGFVRGRTDNNARTAPEFEDPTTHRVTNASGGGLLRAGATFYW
ncbi:MAG TPA: outer membrane beta-barrel protein [Polyangiaceae bacterium]|jgi:opacity protein-like surface antigen|nr:outer membrane beta-barrel protein [Polyangiaceae bacterium]